MKVRVSLLSMLFVGSLVAACADSSTRGAAEAALSWNFVGCIQIWKLTAIANNSTVAGILTSLIL